MESERSGGCGSIAAQGTDLQITLRHGSTSLGEISKDEGADALSILFKAAQYPSR